VIVDGVLYVGSADGAVYAVDAMTGDTKWRFQTGEHLSAATSGVQVVATIAEAEKAAAAILTQGRRTVDMAPAVGKGTVFIGSGDRSFYAIDAASGKKKWSYEAGGGLASNNSSYPYPAALLIDRVVYFVAEGGLHAVDAETGERKWFVKNVVEPWHGPVLGNGVIFLTTGALLYAVDWGSGQAKWIARVDGSNITSITAPVTARGLVFFATKNGSTKQTTLYAVDAVAGQVKWSAVPEPFEFGEPIIVTAGDAVFIATDKKVSALSMDAGRELWSFRTDMIDGGLWADDRHLYVPTHKGSFESPRNTLHALALSTGQEKWSKGVRGSVKVSLIHDGVVYGGKDPVFAIEAATGKQLWSTNGLGSAQIVDGGKLIAISETVSYFGTDRVDQGYLSAVDSKTGKVPPSK
jgi:serine/threonine-protein kinase